MTDRERPKQFTIDEKWDKIIDTSLRRVVYGTLAGGLSALLLFRGGAARAATTGFGAGFGAGLAYADSQKELEEVLAGAAKTASEAAKSASE